MNLAVLKSQLKKSPFIRDLALETERRWLEVSPFRRMARAELQAKRDLVDRQLGELGRNSPRRFDGKVLVDAMWDNPNHWLRYSFLRSALGLANGGEVGVLGRFAVPQCRRTLQTLGVDCIVDYRDFGKANGAIRQQAEALIAATRRPEDILEWRLPEGVPGAIVYDGLLKRQRTACVDICHPEIVKQVSEALVCIERGQRLFDRFDFGMAVLTHPFNFSWGSLGWIALSRDIPVILPLGLYGVQRFTRLTEPTQLTDTYDRPSGDEIGALLPVKADALAAVGREYLAMRRKGRADDQASVYAYQRRPGQIDRKGIADRFGWDTTRPIVAIYTSNWFDWPHQHGMTRFRDFLDWVTAIVEAAEANTGVNWLFKPHPCEEMYGSASLADVMPSIEAIPYIAIADSDWNTAAVMESVDALITYHGTSGIEAAAIGKPVLVSDRGIYDQCGFVLTANSREDYEGLLAREWWKDLDLDATRRRAEIFAGWYFCAPSWQAGFILEDDCLQEALYDSIPGLLAANPEAIERELAGIRQWYDSGHSHSHTYKMMHADSFMLSNV